MIMVPVIWRLNLCEADTYRHVSKAIIQIHRPISATILAVSLTGKNILSGGDILYHC